MTSDIPVVPVGESVAATSPSENEGPVKGQKSSQSAKRKKPEKATTIQTACMYCKLLPMNRAISVSQILMSGLRNVHSPPSNSYACLKAVAVSFISIPELSLYERDTDHGFDTQCLTAIKPMTYFTLVMFRKRQNEVHSRHRGGRL
jgi:hypothetical protein